MRATPTEPCSPNRQVPLRTLLAGAVCTLLLALTGCSGSTGAAFGYGSGDGTGSTSSMPMRYADGTVLGVPLDNRSAQPVELVSLIPLRSDNIAVGATSVAPVLRDRGGDWMLFGANRPSEDATLAAEWAKRKPADGYRVPGRARNLQGLLEVSVRDASRPARVVGVTITYRQDGRVVTETTGETFCFFPEHRASACDLP